MTTNVAPPAGGSKPDFAHVPEDLKDCAQWVLHRNKVPYQPNGSLASVTDPKTWSTFIECLKAVQSGDFDGLSIIVTADDPYTVVDIDHCRDPETGETDPWALEIVHDIGSWWETSFSGTGLRGIARASVPEKRNVNGIEIFSHSKAFTITGARIDGTSTTIEDAQEAITKLWEELTAQKGGPSGKAAKIDQDAIEWGTDPESIRERADKIIASDPQFRRTWQHDRPDLADQSLSSYDLSLLSQAARHHDWRNPTHLYLLLRLHRQEHGDPRKKYKRRDYVCATIGKALAGLEDEDEEDDAGTDVSITIKVELGGLAKATRNAAAALGLWTRANPMKGVYRRGNVLVQPMRVADEAELDDGGVQRGRLAIVPLDGAQPRSSRVTLADGVGSEQAEAAVLTQQTEGASIELRHQIGIAVGAFVDCLQPVRIRAQGTAGPAHEGLP